MCEYLLSFDTGDGELLFSEENNGGEVVGP